MPITTVSRAVAIEAEPFKAPRVHQQDNHHYQQTLQRSAWRPLHGIRMAQQQRYRAEQHQADNADGKGRGPTGS